MEIIILVLVGISIILNIVLLMQTKQTSNKNEYLNIVEELNQIKGDLLAQTEKANGLNLDFIQRQLEAQSKSQRNLQEQLTKAETLRFNDFSINTQNTIRTLGETVNQLSQGIDNRFEGFQSNNDKQLNLMRETLEKKVTSLQDSNEKKLDEMRATVDEKLQQTLEDRISKSFKLVSERLEEVYKSLGEMQKLSTGVDDLKKVLSNVKTRGILGEVQLGAILEQILTPDQYDTNVVTKKGSADRVEFAVKLPGDDGNYIYLPIDAKFPMDAYQNLQDAYEKGIQAEVDAAAKVLTNRIKSFAKDIRNKYIDVPNTTEFGIMFLPIEGLYAEVVRRGMVEELQKEKINIAGPTTMAALLNSLQMGFKTLAIQKRSSEVWGILEGAKQEFGKFEQVLEKTQLRMRQVSDELDNLIGTRTKAINRKLRDVSLLESADSNLDEFKQIEE